MNRFDSGNSIISTFCSKSRDFAASQGAITSEFFPLYKGKDRLKEITARVYFNSFILDFVYSISSFGSVGPKSILDCRIWLEKNEEHLCFSLYDLMFLIDQNNFKCYFFPFIETPKKMTRCFEALAEDLRLFIPRITEIAQNEEQSQLAYNVLKTDIETVFDKNMFKPDNDLDQDTADYVFATSLNRYYEWVKLRLASKCYAEFLDGNYVKSIQRCEKYKTRLAYEDRLLAFMKSLPEGGKYDAVAPDLNTLRDGLKIQTGASELPAFFAAWFLLALPLTLIFLGLYYLFLFISSGNAEYSTGLALYNALYVFLPAIITAIALSYFIRRRIYKFIYRKKLQKMLDYDAIMNTQSESKFMKGFAYIILIGSLIFTPLLAHTDIAFYTYEFVDNSAFFSLKGDSYSYDQIESVWRIEGSYNALGDWVDYPFYVFLMKDGTIMDQLELMEYSDIEKNLLPILQKRGLTIHKAKTEDDIRQTKN